MAVISRGNFFAMSFIKCIKKAANDLQLRLRVLIYLNFGKNQTYLIFNQITLKQFQQLLLLSHPIWLQAGPCHKCLIQELQREGFLQGSHWSWVEARIVVVDTSFSLSSYKGQQVLSSFLASCFNAKNYRIYFKKKLLCETYKVLSI